MTHIWPRNSSLHEDSITLRTAFKNMVPQLPKVISVFIMQPWNCRVHQPLMVLHPLSEWPVTAPQWVCRDKSGSPPLFAGVDSQKLHLCWASVVIFMSLLELILHWTVRTVLHGTGQSSQLWMTSHTPQRCPKGVLLETHHFFWALSSLGFLQHVGPTLNTSLHALHRTLGLRVNFGPRNKFQYHVPYDSLSNCTLRLCFLHQQSPPTPSIQDYTGS